MGTRMFGWMTRYWRALFHPQVDEAAVQRHLRAIKERLPTPVVWLLGKAQSGKTSIIHDLTGDPRAKIGNGFEPCTKSSLRYAFPDKEFPLVEFLDTRGLDDASYDPSEDVKWHEQQSHLVMVVMRVMDHAQGSLLAIVEDLRRRKPDWPIIVVQTCLHEGYTWREPRHILPYPFDKEPLPSEVPPDLTRSLLAQRAWFRGETIRYVAIDFTLPEDGFEPQFYGLQQLWRAIEEALPLGLWSFLKEGGPLSQSLAEPYAQAAEQTILAHTVLAAGAAAVPVAAIDIPLIVAIQFHMAQRIAKIYGQSLTGDRWLDLMGTLGWSFLTRLGVRFISRELLKLLPWVGVPVAATFMGASTYALGRMLAWYFAEIKHGHLPDQHALRRMYEKEWERARDRLGGVFSSSSKEGPEKDR